MSGSVTVLVTVPVTGSVTVLVTGSVTVLVAVMGLGTAMETAMTSPICSRIHAHRREEEHGHTLAEGSSS